MPEAKDKGLGITERRMLKEIVNEDFAALTKEMNSLAEELIVQRKAEIEEEYRDRAVLLDQAANEWREMRTRYEQEVQDWRTRLREGGIVVRPSRNSNLFYFEPEPRISLQDKEAALTAVDNEVRLQVNRARTAVERKKLEIQRKILLSGVNSEAATQLLNEIPNPRELIGTALRQAQTPTLVAIEGRNEERTA